MYRFMMALATLLVLAACAEPLPPDKSSYAGSWRSPAMSVVITQEGRVAYKRRIGTNTSKSVSGPLNSFEGDNFIVGFWPFKIAFEVSTPPHEDNGRWKMTVDGVELTREQP